ncbi:MAG: M23 family metallopeptidase [Candidatus Melainabacteria bacterium]
MRLFQGDRTARLTPWIAPKGLTRTQYPLNPFFTRFNPATALAWHHQSESLSLFLIAIISTLVILAGAPQPTRAAMAYEEPLREQLTAETLNEPARELIEDLTGIDRNSDELNQAIARFQSFQQNTLPKAATDLALESLSQYTRTLVSLNESIRQEAGIDMMDNLRVVPLPPMLTNDETTPKATENDHVAFFNLGRPVQTAILTSHFGMRHGRPHQGIDLAAPIGTHITAAEAGKVVFSGWYAGYGNLVTVDHGNGIQTRYAHCNSLAVKTGMRVEKGQLIATLGTTGHSTGPHVHFELLVKSHPVNPERFLAKNTRRATLLAMH